MHKSYHKKKKDKFYIHKKKKLMKISDFLSSLAQSLKEQLTKLDWEIKGMVRNFHYRDNLLHIQTNIEHFILNKLHNSTK